MSTNEPEVVSRQELTLSPWVTLVRKEVRFQPDADPQAFHSLMVADYVAILARTPSGRIPVVRQYRPAIGTYTLELPAGLVDAGEDPEATCRRELREETGLQVEVLQYLGNWYTDTGRLENRLHAFLATTVDDQFDRAPEQDITVELVTRDELCGLIRNGYFRHQLHIGVLALAQLHDGKWWT